MIGHSRQLSAPPRPQHALPDRENSLHGPRREAPRVYVSRPLAEKSDAAGLPTRLAQALGYSAVFRLTDNPHVTIFRPPHESPKYPRPRQLSPDSRTAFFMRFVRDVLHTAGVGSGLTIPSTELKLEMYGPIAAIEFSPDVATVFSREREIISRILGTFLRVAGPIDNPRRADKFHYTIAHLESWAVRRLQNTESRQAAALRALELPSSVMLAEPALFFNDSAYTLASNFQAPIADETSLPEVMASMLPSTAP